MKSDVRFDTLVCKEDGVYISYCPQFDVSSCGDTVEEARSMLREAVGLFIREPKNWEHFRRYWMKLDSSLRWNDRT